MIIRYNVGYVYRLSYVIVKLLCLPRYYDQCHSKGLYINLN